jgi:GNAT superfamily N-acetyltransferase
MSASSHSADFDLRVAGVDDLDLVLDLMQGLYAFDHIPFDPARARRALVVLLADSSLGRVFLVEVRGQAIGYAVLTLGYSLEFAGRYALLDELFILEAHRGRGAGRYVLTFLEIFCRKMGLQALRLEVGRANRGAQDLYAEMGFELHDRDLMTLWIDRAGKS